jgi:hypothetical protein
MRIRWNKTKNERLRKTRGAGFDSIIRSRLIAVKEPPGKAHQNIMLFEFKGYVWVVPYVMEESGIFLKTLYPSRKYTKMIARGEIL